MLKPGFHPNRYFLHCKHDHARCHQVAPLLSPTIAERRLCSMFNVGRNNGCWLMQRARWALGPNTSERRLSLLNNSQNERNSASTAENHCSGQQSRSHHAFRNLRPHSRSYWLKTTPRFIPRLQISHTPRLYQPLQ